MFPISRTQSPDTLASHFDRSARIAYQRSLERPQVSGRESPVVGSELAQVEQRISFDASGKIHKRIDVAHGKRSNRAEYRFPPVQTRIARPPHGAPASALPVHENDVIEIVD